MLGGMHVDVYPIAGHLQVQHVYRVTPMKHHITVCLPNRMAHQLVAYGAAVHIKELLIHLTTIVVGKSHPAIEPQIEIAFVDVDRIFNEIGTDNP